MKRLVIGVLAHVDSGKTTLAEALLFRAGVIRKLGRVDHRDAFLDTDALERARGITIFAKQAELTLPAGRDGGVPLEETGITLLDTPGHVDFSAEAERTLQVLDYAILVISGTDGVQSHTATLWRLLERYHVPTLIFVNKMDLPGADREVRLRELRGRFGDGCVDFSADASPAARAEALALCSEPLMNAFLAGDIAREDLVTAIARRQVFPCYFGSALRMEGIDALLTGLQRDTRMPPAAPDFGAQVFKIGADDQGARLTYLKVTGGVLKVKSTLCARPDARAAFEEKADQLRLYSGSKFRLISEAPAGTVCAITGLTKTYPGQGLGSQPDARMPILEPVLNYRVELPEGADPHHALRALRTLEEEDPQLHVVWNDALGEIHLQLMGEVQLEILQSVLHSRFGLEVDFGEGGILCSNVTEFLPEMRRARFLGTDFSKHIPNWLYDVTAIRGKNGPFVATNFSTTEIQGLGLQLQIARIDQIIEARRRASEYLTKRLSACDALIPQDLGNDEIKPTFHLYQLQIIPEKAGGDIQLFKKKMDAKGVTQIPHFGPLYKFEILREYGYDEKAIAESCPVCEEVFNHRFTHFPVYGLTPEQLDYMADAILESVDEMQRGV